MPMYTEKIAVLGGGNLGTSIVKGLLKSGYNAYDLIVTRRRIHLLEKLEEEKVNITDDNYNAVQNARMLIIAVKPHQVFSLLNQIKTELDSSKHILVSVVTGVTINELKAVTGQIPLFRAMPNTAIAYFLHNSGIIPTASVAICIPAVPRNLKSPQAMATIIWHTIWILSILS